MHYKHLHTIISFCYRIKNDKKYHKYNDTELLAESATQGQYCPPTLHTPATSQHMSKTFTLAMSCDLVYLQVA